VRQRNAPVPYSTVRFGSVDAGGFAFQFRRHFESDSVMRIAAGWRFFCGARAGRCWEDWERNNWKWGDGL
jgi:hypothetical protein